MSVRLDSFISPEFFRELEQPQSFISPELEQDFARSNACQGRLNQLEAALNAQTRFTVLTSDFKSVSLLTKVIDYILSLFGDAEFFDKRYGQESVKTSMVNLVNECRREQVTMNEAVFRQLVGFSTTYEPLTLALVQLNPQLYLQSSPQVEIELQDATDLL